MGFSIRTYIGSPSKPSQYGIADDFFDGGNPRRGVLIRTYTVPSPEYGYYVIGRFLVRTHIVSSPNRSHFYSVADGFFDRGNPKGGVLIRTYIVPESSYYVTSPNRSLYYSIADKGFARRK